MDGSFVVNSLDKGLSSLLLYHHDKTYLIDCWLSNHYCVLHPWFYSAKRAHDQAFDLHSLPRLDGIFLTSKQNDHSDCQTLSKLANINPATPIFGQRSIGKKVIRAGFNQMITLEAGIPYQLSPTLVLWMLKGYGGCSPFLFQDTTSLQTLCIAPHGIDINWLEQRFLLQHPLKIDTLFIGLTPTALKPFGRFAWIMLDAGINIPMPDESLKLLNLLSPKLVYPMHYAKEIRTGWATHHLIQFPLQSLADNEGLSLAVHFIKTHYHAGHVELSTGWIS